MKTISELTGELHGQLCWGVKWDRQLNMSLNFGQPHLRVREPYATTSRSQLIRELSTYRRVTVTGRWWLGIYCAYWKLSINDLLTATNSSPARGKILAMARLDGQKLKDIRVNPLSGATNFEFDLGATLQARRHGEDDRDIWALYKPNGYVLSVRGDGTFTYHRAAALVPIVKPRKIGTPNQAL